MNDALYRFSVLRVIPNAMRGERINVGVAITHPNNRVTVHLGANTDRLKALDPNLTAIRWKTWQEQASDTLQSMPPEARKFWLMHGMRPVVSDEEEGCFRTSEHETFDEIVSDLLRRMVDLPERVIRATKTKQVHSARLHSQLKSWFKGRHIMGSNIDDMNRRCIVEDYPVSRETDTFAEFAFMNGAVHVIETLDLRNVEQLTQRQRNQAAFKSVVLDEARAVTGSSGRRIAVVSATNYEAVRPALRIVERTADDVISMESRQDVLRFANHISRSLHLPSELESESLLSA
ncbi:MULTISPECIES: DUF3037 domain-containing protein [unclassified Caballeronia]|uniref:DUF3037 domain-containing protein n=1 Tax=unclassified Caballeronia TaxID=2646786 RepID=UPI0020286B48|nr:MULTISPECIES: DUF3037 domain-containing protein [unclassified Caballeronia]